MQKKQIPIIALAVFSIAILLTYGNMEKVFALSYTTLTSTNYWVQPYRVSGADRLAVFNSGIGGGDTELLLKLYDVNDDFTFTLRTTLTTGICCGSEGSFINAHTVTGCGDHVCLYFFTQNSAGTLGYIQKYDLTSQTFVTSFNTDTVSDCDQGYAMSAVNQRLYISMASCTAPTSRMVVLDISETASITLITSVDATRAGAGSFSLDLCYDTIAQRMWWADNGGTAPRIIVFFPDINSFGTASGSGATGYGGGLVCDNDGDFVYAGQGTTVDRVNQITFAFTDSWKTGFNTQVSQLDYYRVPDTLYVQDNANLVLVKASDASTIASIATGDKYSVEFSENEEAVYAGGDLSSQQGTTIFRIHDPSPEAPPPSGGNQQNGFCGNGTLRDCMGDNNALSGLVPPNQNITSVGTTICQGIGLCDPNNDNPRTNGTGLWLMLITGTFFAVALMSTVHTLNMRGYISASVKEIDPIFWLFLVVGTVSVAWYLDWIDDIIFAAMTAGLAGLVAFGVLKHFGRI